MRSAEPLEPPVVGDLREILVERRTLVGHGSDEARCEEALLGIDREIVEHVRGNPSQLREITEIGRVERLQCTGAPAGFHPFDFRRFAIAARAASSARRQRFLDRRVPEGVVLHVGHYSSPSDSSGGAT